MIKTSFGTFREGQALYYDVYPHGVNIPAVATPEGPRAIGEWADKFDEMGIGTTCQWEIADDVRPRRPSRYIRRMVRGGTDGIHG